MVAGQFTLQRAVFQSGAQHDDHRGDGRRDQCPIRTECQGDAEEQRELAALTLAELGYESTVAASGEEGLTLLEHHAFDLILLDMVMGKGMDGLDTYRRIQELRPEQKVIIVSGYSESERLAEVLRLGAQAYLKKPYTLVDLGRIIQRVLDSPEGGGTRAPHDLKKNRRAIRIIRKNYVLFREARLKQPLDAAHEQPCHPLIDPV